MKAIYRAVLAPLGMLIFFLFSLPFNKKAKAIFKLRQKAQSLRPEFMQGCYWIHASSGEFEYAKSVIRSLKNKEPGAKILATYSSPSYADAIAKFEGVDHSEPIPFDLQAPVQEFLKHYEPKMLLIARTDLWPEVLWQCKKMKIPRMLFSCSFPSQPRGLERKWKSFLYSLLDYIFVIKETDAQFLATHSDLPSTTVACIGDTRYDQVLYNLSQTQLPLRDDQRPCFLAGSTWPEDEQVLIPALTEMLKQKQLQLVLVPHEPSEKRITDIKQQLDQLGIDYKLHTENPHDFSAPVLIVDQVGILATLYSLADISFIGGSFKAKVHSVMESLGAGCLTCVGPHFSNNREAVDFAQIPATDSWNMVSVIRDQASLKEFMNDVLQNNYNLDDAEAAILAEVHKRQGASLRLIENIERIQNV